MYGKETAKIEGKSHTFDIVDMFMLSCYSAIFHGVNE